MEIVKAKSMLELNTAAAHQRGIQGDTSFKTLSPDDPLLKVIYDELIAPFFPDDERDEYDAIQSYLAQNEANRKKNIQYYVVAALRGGHLIGTTIFSFVGCHGFCIMNGQYTTVVPEERRQHLAKMLSNHRVELAHEAAREFGYRTLDLSIITLAETQNGSHAFDAPSPDPTTLRKIWHAFGHDWINFPFTQLPLADGKKCSRALLGVKRHSSQYLQRNYLNTQEMKCIVDACNFFRVSKAPNAAYPEYLEMIKHLEQHPEFRIGQ